MFPPLKCKSLSLIKIDVEGLELPILQAGSQFLQQHGFPPIFFEAWSKEFFQEQKQALLAFLASLGYQILSISTTDYLAQHPQYPRHLTINRTEEYTELTLHNRA